MKEQKGIKKQQIIQKDDESGVTNTLHVHELIIFYDSLCPLCVMEMKRLQQRDTSQKILLEDIHSPEFVLRYPHIVPQEASTVLHGQLKSGELLLGLDVTHKAWTLAGRGWMTAPLRWSLIRPVADSAYRLFARHRYTISRLLTGKSTCERCSINVNKS